MIRRRGEFPSKGELVIGTVDEINPNSIFIKLDEYGKVGMVHISEVASKWVRDIRNWASEEDKVICKVKDVRKKKEQIDLSLKDVSDRGKNKRMQQWKRDQRGDEFLENIGDKKDLSEEETYKKIGYDLEENFKDILEPFELAVRKGLKELEKRGLSKDWASEIEEVGEEEIKIKEEKVKRRFKVQCREPNGIETIKNALLEVSKKNDVEFKYISAPEYEISYMASDLKEGEDKLKESLEELDESLKGKKAQVESPFK